MRVVVTRLPTPNALARGAWRAVLTVAMATRVVSAQTTVGDEVSRALDLEGAGKLREAAALFRAAAASATATDDTRLAAMLGLERAYHALGYPDSVLVVVEPALRTRPQDPTLRTIQLRALRAVGRDDALRAAFEQWRRAIPDDAAPYREYARILLQAGRAQTADTVLRQAQRMLRGSRELTFERAQLHAALGAWALAGSSWREAIDVSPYAEQAAVFALQGAPLASRDSIRSALLVPPAGLVPRRVASTLSLGWREPREGWAALAPLPANDSSVNAWVDFAERAEQANAWAPARDAWLAAYRARRREDARERAAAAALGAGDAAGALALLDEGAGAGGRGSVSAASVALRVQILARLGRAAEAQAAVERAGAGVDTNERKRLAALVADAWVRAGDVVKARAALTAAGSDDDGEAAGWLALYGGDLKRARELLKRASSGDGPALSMTALALLARVRLDTAEVVGAAFLAVARGDTARAIERFEAAARALPDAAPIALGAAARLRLTRADTAGAEALWRAIVTDHAASPEAPEADLEWARTLLRRGDRAGAVQRFEHLILTYPRSALVPLARRELEAARAG